MKSYSKMPSTVTFTPVRPAKSLRSTSITSLKFSEVTIQNTPMLRQYSKTSEAELKLLLSSFYTALEAQLWQSFSDALMRKPSEPSTLGPKSIRELFVIGP